MNLDFVSKLVPGMSPSPTDVGTISCAGDSQSRTESKIETNEKKGVGSKINYNKCRSRFKGCFTSSLRLFVSSTENEFRSSNTGDR